jgi:unsaturated chondroitin disaccharide hydrolase
MRTKQLIRSQPFDRLEPRMLLSTVATTPVAAQLQSAIQFAQAQLTTTATTDLANNPADYIDYTKANGTWDVTNAGSWSAGAWPAELWELYDLTGNANWKAEAQSWSTNLVSQDAQTSDDYLRIYDPFIYAYDDSASAQAASAITTAAMSRVSTFNAAVGAWSEPWRSSSSGNPAANFGVLLDQTMDTQEVFWAAAYTGNTTLYNDAVAEMTTAEKYLVRSDGSTAQFAYFNAGTGAFIDQETYAGYSAASTWSRGQAWAINSFANAYQQTHRADFLATAESLANYYIAHVPSDGVPYWDYDDPSIPNANRDTSAAAIAATGLLQLAQVDPTAANAQKYYHQAETILGSLCSTYLATGTTSHGILLEGDDLNFGVIDRLVRLRLRYRSAALRK